ncbi:zinc transporter 2 isoform X3 [Stigmatopora argus]
MSMDVKASSSEKSQLIHDQNHKTYCERVHSSFLDPSEPFPLKNGGMTGVEAALQRAGDSHCHRHAALPAPGGDDAGRDGVLAQKKLYLASAVCLVFMIGEIIGGYLAHSLAIMTDAAHLLTDLGSMLVRPAPPATPRTATSLPLRRDPGRFLLRPVHLDGDGRFGLPGRAEDRTRRLRDRRSRDAAHLRFRRGGQHPHGVHPAPLHHLPRPRPRLSAYGRRGPEPSRTRPPGRRPRQHQRAGGVHPRGGRPAAERGRHGGRHRHLLSARVQSGGSHLHVSVLHLCPVHHLHYPQRRLPDTHGRFPQRHRVQVSEGSSADGQGGPLGPLAAPLGAYAWTDAGIRTPGC